ncbi:hypothetical protein PR048_027329 [Dryococelus australis]|uniref:Uncharacterized protein n=1 Tax=Dryococelus australis TaxID=614101 RepID=A0ABQ9GF53_9NEOP|nr:hypothetical protein PR048_027329 [Dryococelus australis]
MAWSPLEVSQRRVIDGKSARQFSAWRVEATRELVRMSRSPLELPRLLRAIFLQPGGHLKAGWYLRNLSAPAAAQSPTTRTWSNMLPTTPLVLIVPGCEPVCTFPPPPHHQFHILPGGGKGGKERQKPSGSKVTRSRGKESKIQLWKQLPGATLGILYNNVALQLECLIAPTRKAYSVSVVTYCAIQICNSGVLLHAMKAHRLNYGGPGFSHGRIVPGDVADRRVLSVTSPFPRPDIPALLHTRLTPPLSSVKASMPRLCLPFAPALTTRSPQRQLAGYCGTRKTGPSPTSPGLVSVLYVIWSRPYVERHVPATGQDMEPPVDSISSVLDLLTFRSCDELKDRFSLPTCRCNQALLIKANIETLYPAEKHHCVSHVSHARALRKLTSPGPGLARPEQLSPKRNTWGSRHNAATKTFPFGSTSVISQTSRVLCACMSWT